MGPSDESGCFKRIERDESRPPGGVHDAGRGSGHPRPPGDRGPTARCPRWPGKEIDAPGPACVFAYHEIVASPGGSRVPTTAKALRRGLMMAASRPIFTAGCSPRERRPASAQAARRRALVCAGSVAALRAATGLDQAATLRREGAPIPMKPLSRWDNGRDVLVAGDAAGVVAPASGEGIYYAMVSGQLAAETGQAFLEDGDPRRLRQACKRFIKAHGRVFFILGIMQHFWYRSDRRRERFVSMCRDRDVQELTWQAYMNKELVRARPGAHLRIFFKGSRHLLGIGSP